MFRFILKGIPCETHTMIFWWVGWIWMDMGTYPYLNYYSHIIFKIWEAITKVILCLARGFVDPRCVLLLLAVISMNGIYILEQPSSSLIMMHERMVWLQHLLESLLMRVSWKLIHWSFLLTPHWFSMVNGYHLKCIINGVYLHIINGVYIYIKQGYL
jgi:hypothetical protein